MKSPAVHQRAPQPQINFPVHCNRATWPAQVHRSRRQPHMVVVSAAGGASMLEKLGRVLREKAVGDFERVFQGASKTRAKLGVVEELFTYWNLDQMDDELEQLEELLITADFGPRTALKVVDELREEIKRGGLKSGLQIRTQLKASIVALLQRCGSSDLQLGDARPAVILIVGVNGGGKTTTIGKLAHQLRGSGASVLLAAGDTFRAAATEQLEAWAERSGASIHVAANEKQRPDGVLYQAVEKAKQGGIDVVLCDTSGRLHTNVKLMEELAKCKRSVGKCLPGAPHETLLVLDGTTGLNMLNQAREFNETVQLSGLVLTKLDGTARGGAVISVIDELGIPVKFVGVGEGLDDLQPFDAESFVEALFPSVG